MQRSEPAPGGAARRIPALDGIRALSIGLVLCAHLMGDRGFGLSGGAFLNLGELGVRVFFVISGFLITTLLLAEMGRTGTISLSGFYLRRAYRILPASHVYALGMIALGAAGLIALLPGDALHALTFSMNYHPARSWPVGHLWSLAVEEQFYLLWPFVLRGAGRRRGMGIAAAAVVLAPAVRVASWVLWPADRGSIGESFPTACDALATGCLLAGARAWLGQSPRYLRWLRSPLGAMAPVAAIGANLLVRHPMVDFTIGHTFVNAAIALSIDRAVRFQDGLWPRVLDASPLVFVGQLSYSLYLWQQPFLDRSSDGIVSRFPLSLALAILAALASHYLVERPFLRYRDRARGRAAERGARLAGVP